MTKDAAGIGSLLNSWLAVKLQSVHMRQSRFQGPPRRAAMGMHSPPGRAQSRQTGMPVAAVSAIHRGHLPSPEQSPARGAAHGATNLFRRGHYTLLEGIAEGHLAHGELQEEKSPAPGRYFPGTPPILRA